MRAGIAIERTQAEVPAPRNGRPGYRWAAAWKIVNVYRDGTTCDAVQPYCTGRGAKGAAEADAKRLAEQTGEPYLGEAAADTLRAVIARAKGGE